MFLGHLFLDSISDKKLPRREGGSMNVVVAKFWGKQLVLLL